MKLLVDCSPLSQGGGVQAAIAFLANLQERSDIVWQAVLPESLRPFLPISVAADARVSFVRKRSGLHNVAVGRVLLKIERTFSPDVVFTVFGPAYFRARACHVVGFAMPNLIYEPDGPLGSRTISDRLRNWIRRVMLRRADHLVVETETVRTRLSQCLGIAPSRISVIGNSVNPLLLREAIAHDPPMGRFGFLLPSAYYRHKNLEITPAVAAAMRRIDPQLDFEFRFTLEASSKNWRAIKGEAKRLGVADRLVTLGVLRLEILARAYREASAVFLPTLREASTAVYPESFFFGRPLVTSDMDFARELCDDAALFVPPLDSEEIAAQLVELARSPELRERLFESGKRHLSNAFPQPAEKFSIQIDLLRSMARSPIGDLAAAARDSGKLH